MRYLYDYCKFENNLKRRKDIKMKVMKNYLDILIILN